MASSYTQVRQYRDPVQLDISNTLGKAATYKQNLYDANTTAMQQLINQYAGIDLIKDIDQNYLGDRLKTLTNYINQAGAMDWSRRSVFNDVSNYVGQALDSNVMNAISSTQALMKQNAEIEQKKKEGKYGVANEWLAKAGLEDYLKSNKVGDIYRPGQYFDYVDINKKVIENSKLIKDMGGEVYFEQGDSTPYFRTIKKGERLTPQKVKQWTEMLLGEDGIRQMSITGLYEYRGKNEDDVKKDYSEYVNEQIEKNNKLSADIALTATNKTGDDKKNYLKLIEELKDQNTTLEGKLKNNYGRESMISEMYVNRQMNKFASTLAYDNIVDYKIDDSPLKALNYQLDVQKENNAENYRKADLALKEGDQKIKLLEAGLKKNEKTGQLEWDANNPNNPSFKSGINVVTNPDKKGEVIVEPVGNAYEMASSSFSDTVSAITEMLKTEFKNPEYTKIVEQYGLKGNSISQIAGAIVNSPSKFGKLDNLVRQLGNSDKYRYLKINEKIDQTKSNLQLVRESDSALSPAFEDISRREKQIMSTPKAKENYDLYTNYTVNSDGNLIKGDAKKQNDYNGKIIREIGIMNNILANGNMDNSQRVAMKRMRDLKLRELKGFNPKKENEYKEALYLPDNQTFGELVEGVAEGVVDSFKAIFGVRPDVRKKEPVKRDYLSRFGNEVVDFFTRYHDDEDFDSSNKVTKYQKGFGYYSENKEDFYQKINGKLDNVKNIIVNNSPYLSTPQPKSLIMDNGDKSIEPILPLLKNMIPSNAELVKDGITKIDINENGGYNVTIPVKIGKDIQTITAQASVDDLPSNLTNSIMVNTKHLYNAKNKFAQQTVVEVDLPETVSEFKENEIPYTSADRRTYLANYTPSTKKDLYEYVNTMFNDDIVQKHKSEIEKIINENLKISIINEQNQWTIVGNNGRTDVYRKPTYQEDYSPENVYDTKYRQAYEIKIEQLNNILNGR